jgi:hypothetical protein
VAVQPDGAGLIGPVGQNVTDGGGDGADHIALDHTPSTGLTLGTLPPDAFRANPTARIIYDTGGAAGIKCAMVEPDLAPTEAAFLIL